MVPPDGKRLEAPSLTSPSLITQVRQRDPGAWTRLSYLYGPLVYRWARQEGVQANDADDVVQEVFLGVAGSIATFEARPVQGSFRRWLWGITRNKVHDYFRRMIQEPRAIGGTDAHVQIQNQQVQSPESEVRELPEVDASLVHRAMDLLRSDFEETTWRAFWRVTVDGQSAAHVADELGMTKKAVRQAKYRVLHRLRAELED